MVQVQVLDITQQSKGIKMNKSFEKSLPKLLKALSGLTLP